MAVSKRIDGFAASIEMEINYHESTKGLDDLANSWVALFKRGSYELAIETARVMEAMARHAKDGTSLIV